MRKRNIVNQPDADEGESDPEDAIKAAEPDENLPAETRRVLDVDSDAFPIWTVGSNRLLPILLLLKEGKIWWAQCLTISIAAILTYSYNNVGDHSTNVQIAIMTVITLVGASPFCSTHLAPAAIGAFVGGHNIIGANGLLSNENEIYYSNMLWLLILSNVVGLIWCFVMNSRLKILDGYAGRLGTTTFLGMNVVMLTVYGPCGVVDWDRYYYGLVQVIRIAEEDATLKPLASAWDWTEEAELAIGYVLAVLWLGVCGGAVRIFHDIYIQKCERGNKDSLAKQTPAALSNILVPVLLALFSMLVINATQYKHSAGLFNGFAVGAYVAMASLKKIPTVLKFLVVSGLAAGWGLALTPFFVGFAGKSGFTSMLGHLTYGVLDSLIRRISLRREQLRRDQHLSQQKATTSNEQDLQHRQDQQPLPSFDAKDHDQHDQHDPDTTHYHKPKKETFYTKQQRRQKQRLQNMHPQQQSAEEEEAPKLHHRAWSALPTDGDGVWHHSLEDNPEIV